MLIECAACLCGYKKDEAHVHLPEWIVADVPFHLRKLVTPWLHVEIVKVMASIDLCEDHVELTRKCLNIAKGCLHAIEIL